MKYIKKLVDYVKESYVELKKVVWPNKKQTKNYTIVVVAMSIGIAVFFAVLDYLFNLLLGVVI